MKKMHIPVLAITLGLVTASCGMREIEGEGATKTENRAVGNVSKIHISAPVVANITIQPGAKTSVQLSGYENLLKYVETTVDGSTLHIRTKPATDLDTDRDLVANIIVSSLEELDLSGASDANVKGPVSSSKFDLDISGAGDVNIEQLTVTELNIDVSGAGKANIARGTVAKASYDVSGAGDINAFGLQVNDLSIDVSGAGNTSVSAVTNLDAEVSGAGSIRYKGRPAIKANTSGAGQIVAAN